MNEAEERAKGRPPHYHFTRSWLDHFARFEEEIHTIYRVVVAPSEQRTDEKRFEYALWSYIARSFAFIDWFSRFYSRSDTATKRMSAFMRQYMGIDGRTAHVAVNLWRHPLAHDPFPIFQMDKKTEYHPHAQWCADKELHLRIRQRDDEQDYPGERGVRYMDVSLLTLVADVHAALTQYVAELDDDAALQKNYALRWTEETLKEFK